MLVREMVSNLFVSCLLKGIPFILQVPPLLCVVNLSENSHLKKNNLIAYDNVFPLTTNSNDKMLILRWNTLKIVPSDYSAVQFHLPFSI